MRVTPAILFIAGGIIILAGVGLWVWQTFGPTPPPELEPYAGDPIPAFNIENEQLPNVRFDSEPDVEPTATTTPKKVAWGMPDAEFTTNGLTFKEGVESGMIFYVQDGRLTLPTVEIHQWEPGLVESDLFKPGEGTGIAYTEDFGNIVLWLHSGLGQTMSHLQRWIERSDQGYRVPWEKAVKKINTELIGSEVFIDQRGLNKYGFFKVTAAVRVPPSGVLEVSKHVMDLVPYLAATYPGAGFEKIIETDDALILYFCGMALAGETPIPQMDRWTQARFVVALEPIEESTYGDSTPNSREISD